MPEPLHVEVTRGSLVESRHEVRATVTSGDEYVVFGDQAERVLPRSAVKMFQALPLVMSGAASAHGLGDVELALACASHSGERRHVEAVRAWLERLGLDEDALECGAQLGRPEGPVANNCSGKHAGFLTLAHHLGVDSSGYIEPDHPVQEAVTAALISVMDFELDHRLIGVDGCGIPVHPVPLANLAKGVESFADPPSWWDHGLADAAGRLVSAMTAEPVMVGGSERLCTELMQDVPGLVVKAGAEGVYVVAEVGRSWGAAVKSVDGATRGAEQAVLHLIEQRGHQLSERLRERRTVRNWAGKPVGQMSVL